MNLRLSPSSRGAAKAALMGLRFPLEAKSRRSGCPGGFRLILPVFAAAFRFRRIANRGGACRLGSPRIGRGPATGLRSRISGVQPGSRAFRGTGQSKSVRNGPAKVSDEGLAVLANVDSHCQVSKETSQGRVQLERLMAAEAAEGRGRYGVSRVDVSQRLTPARVRFTRRRLR